MHKQVCLCLSDPCLLLLLPCVRRRDRMCSQTVSQICISLQVPSVRDLLSVTSKVMNTNSGPEETVFTAQF